MKLFVTRPDRQKYVVEITLSEPTPTKWFFDGFGGIHIDNRFTINWNYYSSILSQIKAIGSLGSLGSEDAFGTSFLKAKE